MEIDWNKLTSETGNYPLSPSSGTISGEKNNQPVPVPVELDGTAYADLDEIFASDYNNERLTKEQIIIDRHNKKKAALKKAVKKQKDFLNHNINKG